MSEARFHYPEALVSTDWLAQHLADPELRVYDCTTYLAFQTDGGKPYSIVSGRADYEAGHIPGSGFLDLQGEFSVADSPYRFTLPAPGYAAAAFARHGVGDGSRVVLYSRNGVIWATRFWWMLRWLGFDNAAVLDGGYEKWIAEGRTVATEPGTYPAGTLSIAPRPGLFVGKEAVLEAIGRADTCTLNALGHDLHAGIDPRYGRPGRVPGSVNVPAGELVTAQSRELLPPAEVAEAFAEVGATPDKRILTYCGGGIAATLDAFLLHQLGYGDVTVYDSSMSEWATDASLPIETD